MSANGELKASELTLVQADLYLSVKTARAYKRLKAAAKSKLGRTITIAQKAGAYRSVAVQRAIKKAYDSGSVAEKEAWNLDPASHAEPASPGTSNHGLGIAFDVVGTVMDTPFKSLAKQYGFTFPIPSDPHHAVHDGKTATSPFVVPKTVKVVTYTVRPKDTLSGIASTYRTTVSHLLSLNPTIHNANLIRVGQKVRVA